MTAATESQVVESRLGILRGRVDYQGIILGVICTFVTLALLVGARLTSGTIQLRTDEDRLANLNQVMPATLYDNNPLHDVQTIADEGAANPAAFYMARKGGFFTATAFQVVTQGYGGPITMMLAVDENGEILGVRILSHRETPGLADKIEVSRSNWITRFDGLSLTNTDKSHWAVKKDGGQFDQFTGATITPRAVVKGVYEGLQLFERNKASLIASGPADAATE